MPSERMLEILREDIASFEAQWNDYIFDAIKMRPADNLAYNSLRFYMTFAESIVVGVPRDQSLHYLELMKDLGVANFVSSTNDGKTISLPIGDARIDITGQATTAYMDTDTWLKSFYSAILTRDPNAIEILTQIPESVFQNADIKPDGFDLAFVQATKALFKTDSNIDELLIKAMEASDESKLDPIRLDYAWSIHLPVLMLFRFIIYGDGENELAEVLNHGVEQHRIYWNKEENQIRSEGLVSLPLLAGLTMLFENKQIKVPVESEIIPRWLVEEFPGRYLSDD